MLISDASPISGPIQLVDTTPSEAPQILQLKVNQYDEYEETEPSVAITVKTEENVDKYVLYRTQDATKSFSIHSMKSICEVQNEDDEVLLIDDFSIDENIPYGEPLYYKVIGMREIVYANVQGELIHEFVPSKAGRVLMATMIDTQNPTAPELRYTYNEETSSDTELNGVMLSWNKAVYGATYYVYKMNDAGNWTLLDTIVSNDAEISYAIEEPLVIADEDGNPLYNRFKVEVENASGLLSKNDNTIVF